MSTSFSFGNMQVDLNPITATTGRRDPDAPFRIIVLGDFTGRANRGLHDPISTTQPQSPLRVDCDTIDSVIAKLAPTLHLPAPGQNPDQSPSNIEIRFTQLEDFHPDQLYERLDLFKALRKTRRDLLDPATYPAAAAEVRDWACPPTQPSSDSTAAPNPANDSSSDSEGDVFGQLLGKPNTISAAAPSSHSTAQVESLLKQIVGPHIVQATDPQQDQLIAAVDTATSKLMRAILHHPDFQALESAWRSLDFLVRHLETDEQLRLFVFDITKQQLAIDLASTDDLHTTGLYRLLVEQAATVGSDPWAVVVGDFTFDATPQDAQVLGRIAKISAQARAPFIAAAHPHWLGCDSLIDHPSPTDWNFSIPPDATRSWNALRKLPEASYVGLTLPRFLLRLPFSQVTEPIDSFEFDEIPSNPTAASSYLWGNPAFICAYLLGQDYSQYSWGFTPGSDQDIEDLPAHTYKHDGESVMTPCAQAWLTQNAADKIIDTGLMPLLSIRNRDAVRLARFQSIANPPTNLSGGWG